MLAKGIHRHSGVTIAETLFAATCLVISFTALFAASGQSLRLIQAGKQHSAATFCLQQRVEELRTLTWSQLTDATYLRDNVLNAAAGSTAALPGRAEVISINAYPTATTPIVVSRPASGTPTVQSSNSALSSAGLLRLDISISWSKLGGGTGVRQFTTVVTRGGIIR